MVAQQQRAIGYLLSASDRERPFWTTAWQAYYGGQPGKTNCLHASDISSVLLLTSPTHHGNRLEPPCVVVRRGHETSSSSLKALGLTEGLLGDEGDCDGTGGGFPS